MSGEYPVKQILVGLTCLWLLSVAQADELIFMSGDKLLAYCTNEDDGSKDRGICEGYLAGLVDAATTIKSWRRGDVGICIPNDASPFFLRNSILAWGDKNPNDLQTAASAIALNIFREAYPCR